MSEQGNYFLLSKNNSNLEIDRSIFQHIYNSDLIKKSDRSGITFQHYTKCRDCP